MIHRPDDKYGQEGSGGQPIKNCTGIVRTSSCALFPKHSGKKSAEQRRRQHYQGSRVTFTLKCVSRRIGSTYPQAGRSQQQKPRTKDVHSSADRPQHYIHQRSFECDGHGIGPIGFCKMSAPAREQTLCTTRRLRRYLELAPESRKQSQSCCRKRGEIHYRGTPHVSVTLPPSRHSWNGRRGVINSSSRGSLVRA